MQKKILMAFDDPGGGLAVSSLIETLKSEKFELIIYSGYLSRKFIKNSEYKLIESNISKESAKEIFLKSNPGLLITGTSAGNAEQELRNYANANGIPSVVILDFWKDYKRRWLFSEYKIEDSHDYIFVMDEAVKKEMIEEGFPEKNIFITGHPYLDYLFNNHFTESKFSDLKNKYLFLSQPLAVIGIKNYKIHPMEFLLNALSKSSDNKKEIVYLTIKLHPVEELTSEMENLIEKFNTGNLKLSLVKDEIDIKDLILDSDTVIGYNTIAMFEARAMNKRTISIKASEVKESLTLAMIKAGIEIIDIKENSFPDIFMNDKVVLNENGLFKGGILNCKKEILRILN